MIDTEHTFRHHHCFMLREERFLIVSHDVIQASQEPKTHADLWMHRSVDVVQEIMRFRDQLETFPEQSLLDLLLTGGEELIGIARLDDGEKLVTEKDLKVMSTLGGTCLMIG